jgi:hypothetical protein
MNLSKWANYAFLCLILGIKTMRLDQIEIVTLNSIADELDKLNDNDPQFKTINEKIRGLTHEVDLTDLDALLSYINNEIREPLYKFYKDSTNDLTLPNNQIQVILFNVLMLLATFYPVSKNCCISKRPLNHPVIFLSGHLANKRELLTYWETNNLKYHHPLTKEILSIRELLANLIEYSIPVEHLEFLKINLSNKKYRHAYMQVEEKNANLYLDFMASYVVGAGMFLALPAVFGSALIGISGAAAVGLACAFATHKTSSYFIEKHYENVANSKQDDIKQNINLIKLALGRELSKNYLANIAALAYLKEMIGAKRHFTVALPSATLLSLSGTDQEEKLSIPTQAASNTNQNNSGYKLSGADLATLSFLEEKLKHLELPSALNKEMAKIMHRLTIKNKINVSFRDEVLFKKYIQVNIREPLYRIYLSDPQKQLHETHKDLIRSTLLLLAFYYPLNDKCCISNEILEEKRVMFLSGHVANPRALKILWEQKDQVGIHPVLNYRVSFFELKFNLFIAGLELGYSTFNPLELRERLTKPLTSLPKVLYSHLIELSTVTILLPILAGLIATMLWPAIPTFYLATLTFATAITGGLITYKTKCSRDEDFIYDKVSSKIWSLTQDSKDEIKKVYLHKDEARYNEFLCMRKHLDNLRNEATPTNIPQQSATTANSSLNEPSQSDRAPAAPNNWTKIGLHAERKAEAESDARVEDYKRVMGLG